MSEPDDCKQLSLGEGKYRFFTDRDGSLYCERYGKPWRAFVGDHAVSLLFEAAVAASAAPAPAGSTSPEPPAPGGAAPEKRVMLRGQPWLVRGDGYRFWIRPDAGNPLLDRDAFPVLEYKHDDHTGRSLARLMFASLPDTPAPAGGTSPELPAAGPLAARQVAEWLFDYESMLNALANQFRVTRDEDLEGTGRRLEERAKEVSRAAARLYDQKGVVRDSGYQDLLLRECARRLTNKADSFSSVFSSTAELLEAIARHTT